MLLFYLTFYINYVILIIDEVLGVSIVAKLTLKCFGCKQEFRREELINYTPLNSQTSHNYCKKCLEKKQQRENFSNKVCSIFGIKVPGPRIWAERKRLIDKFGYTDNTIIECLDYLYNIKKLKVLSESLTLVNPANVDAMQRYKRQQAAKAGQLTAAAAVKIVEHKVALRQEEKEPEKNLDEWFV